jgi:hypothetical protein
MAKKEEIVTFKADEHLLAALDGMANRSAFIRNAILAALESRCPLCRGTGILNEEQREHWEEFSRRHRIVECDDCHALHLVCDVPDNPLPSAEAEI